MTRYIIVGAGAIGGALGGRLTQHGVPAVLVARGKHASVMASSGLRLRTPDEDVTLLVTAVTGPDETRLDVGDVLVMTTKTHQLQAALTTWVDAPVYRDGAVAGTAGELLPVCTALNGVAAEAMAARYFRSVVGVCIWVPGVHLEPGEIILRAAEPSGMFHVGRYPRGDDVPASLETDWTKAGFKVAVSNDVMRWKHRKLIGNLGNCLQALIGPGSDYAELLSEARAEAWEVFRRVGIDVTTDEEEAAARADSFSVRPVPGQPSQLGGSSWQSLARATGGIETDYLNGEIAAIARRNGFDAPLNAGLARIAREAATASLRPGSLSLEDVRRKLGAVL